MLHHSAYIHTDDYPLRPAILGYYGNPGGAYIHTDDYPLFHLNSRGYCVGGTLDNPSFPRDTQDNPSFPRGTLNNHMFPRDTQDNPSNPRDTPDNNPTVCAGIAGNAWIPHLFPVFTYEYQPIPI